MKRIFSVLLSLFLVLSLFPVTAFAAEENDLSKFELPAPQAPNYFVYTDGNASEGHHDDLRMIMVADPEVALLAAEYDRDSDAFREKYGLWSFEICMQYDVSLDGETNWQHNPEWDTNYYTGGYADGYPYVCLRSELMEDFEFFWLTYYEGPGSDTFVPYQPAIITEVYHDYGYDREVYSFDVENHSLYIRCRYYMEWEPLVPNEYGQGPGEKQSRFSDWSESAIFGKNSTQIIPEEPTTYAAPIISDLKIVLSEGDENCHLEYVQTTPESVWMNGVYYLMKDEYGFDGLETQVSINGGEWIEFDTADAGGDWCLWNGSRSAYNYDVPIEENSLVKLRVRFTGTHGPSPWSNVLEALGGANRVAGINRFDTAIQVADQMRVNLEVEKFDAIIVASGNDFADALAGSYLSAVKRAPILLSWGKPGSYEYLDTNNIDYIKTHLAENGTVYILGGEKAVPTTYEKALMGYHVKRLGGANRFETNLLILEEAGVNDGSEILVCTATNFADSLSASATGKPIFLVWNERSVLYGRQPEYLAGLKNCTFTVIGGENAVSSKLADAIAVYGPVTRLAGADRFQTSVMVAEKYFENPESAVLAYAWNYPDGLCGGSLAYSMGAPLILTMTGYIDNATRYVQSHGIENGIVLGGTALISDEAVREIFTITVESLWDLLSGCWVGKEDRFAYFTYVDSGPAFWSGLWENPQPYGREAAVVSDLNNLGGGVYAMSLTYPPVSDDAADSQDLQELHYTLTMDISGLTHGTITVHAPDDTLRDYTFGGYSYDDAYDASNGVQYATFDEMQEFWQWLAGYWNADNGHFVCFDQKDNSSLVFMHGIWDSGSRGWADFEKATCGYMDLPMEFIVYYSPVSNELDGDLPAEYVTVYVDWMEVETHDRIYVKLGENGVWQRYTFAGYTEEEAYPN